MAANDELPEVTATGRNRFPGPLERFRRGREELSQGAFLPRVQALLSPGLFRERLDTNALMESAFGEGGQLEDLKQTDPETYQAIRDAAANPMQPGEHVKFRSAILDMVDGEVRRKQAIDGQIADNGGYMRVLALMDRAIPGINDPDMETYEEGERAQIQAEFERAQAAAQAGDVEGSKAIMTEVRKRGDALTANTRERMEQYRKQARIEDSALYSASDNARQLLRDSMEDLRKYRERGEVPPDFVLDKAVKAYGAAGALQTTTAGDAAAAALGGGVGGGGAGMAGGVPGVLIGAGTGVVTGGIGGLKDYFKSKKNIAALEAQLGDTLAQVDANYASNRATLAKRFAPVGIKFGEQPGEVYSTLGDAYQAASEKIPESAPRTPEQVNTDRTESLRKTLTSEQEAARAAVAAARPDAAANLPNAQSKLEKAMQREQEANDNLALFESDIAGTMPGREAGDVRDARKRREERAKSQRARDRQEGIVTTLRRFTR